MDPFIKEQLARTIRMHVQRANNLVDRGQISEATELCRQITQRDPQSVGPLVVMMRAAMLNKDWQLATKLGENCLRTRHEFELNGFDPGIDVTYETIAGWLQESCHQAVAQYFADVDDAALPASIHIGFGLAAHVLKDFDRARKHYTHLLSLGEPAEYFVGQVLNLLQALEQQSGRPEDARQWVDLDNFPMEFEGTISAADDGDATFNDRLREEIMASPNLAPWPQFQSDKYFIARDLNIGSPGPCLQAVEDRFTKFMDEHLGKLDKVHRPFKHRNFERHPEDFVMRLFAVVMPDSGFVGPHVHSDCYAVGNYYVHVPQDGEDAPEKANCIEVGKHLYSAATGDDYVRRVIKPKTGTMLMWPAYFSHGTWPGAADETRVVIGFDVEYAR